MADRPPVGLAGWLLVARMASLRLALPLLRRTMRTAVLVRRLAMPPTAAVDPARLRLVLAIAARLCRDPAWRVDLSRRIRAGQARLFDVRDAIASLETLIQTGALPA